VSEASVGIAAVLEKQHTDFGILRRGSTAPLCGSWKHPAVKPRLDLEFTGAWVYIPGRGKTENGNSGHNLGVVVVSEGMRPEIERPSAVAIEH